MKIQRDGGVQSEDFEPVGAEELSAIQSAKADQKALEQAGVTDASGFGPPAPASPTATPAPAPAAAEVPAGATVSAAQLASGTANVNVASTLAAETPKYEKPKDPSNLAAITTGADGQPPLSKQQVIDTVLTALPASQQPAAKALIDRGVTDASLASAFSQVVDASQTPGAKPISIDLVGLRNGGRGAKIPDAAPTTFSGTMTVAADGSVNGKTLPADAAIAADQKPFPNGNPADKIKQTYELTGDPSNLESLTAAHGDQPAISKQAVVDTVLAAIPEAQRGAAKALIDTGVTDDSLARAFSNVVDARKTPGEKTPSIDLVGLVHEDQMVGSGESQSMQSVIRPADSATHFTGQMSVAADGTVNGAKLPADMQVFVATATAGVAAEYKDTTLREAGLSEEWMQNASEDQKGYALAKIIDAKSTPGQKSIDLSFPYTFQQNSGEDSQTVSTRASGVLSLNVDAQGKVNGKALTIDAAVNATRNIDSMPNEVRRGSLKALGFDAATISSASPDQVKNVLVKAAMATSSPGNKQFEVQMGGDKYAVGLKVGDKGQIEGAGSAKIPPPPKKSWWKQAVSVVCTVVSICYPPAALICQGINAAIAVSNGAKGLALVGAIAGAAAGVGDLAGAANFASTMSTVANVATGVNTAVNAAKSGDFLGALSGALSAGAGFGGDLGQTLSTAANVTRGVGAAVNAAKTGDVLGLVSAGLSTAGALGVGGDTINTLSTITNTARAVSSGNITGALDGILTLSGATGSWVPTPNVNTTAVASQADVRRIDNAIDAAQQTVATVSDTARAVADGDTATALAGVLTLGTDEAGADAKGSTATQADVRRVDNDIRATNRTQAEVAQDFRLAFSGARANGESTFMFDKGDGRGPQSYSTGTREEVAASIPGGSTRDYQNFVKANYGGADSAAALAAYRDSKAPPKPVDPLDLAGTIPFGGVPGTNLPGDTNFGLGSALDPRVNNLSVDNGTKPTITRANTGSDFADSLIDRVNTIATNVSTVVSGTGTAELGTLASNVAGGVSRAVSGAYNYVTNTSAADIAADAGASISRGWDKLKADPLGTAGAVVNAVLPVGDIYRGIEKLGDDTLTYGDAARALGQTTMGVVGVVTVGVGGSAVSGARRVGTAAAEDLAADVAGAGAREAATAATAVANDTAEAGRVYLGSGKFSDVFREGDVVVKQAKTEVVIDGKAISLTDAQKAGIAQQTVEFTNDLHSIMPDIVPPMSLRGPGAIEMGFQDGVTIKEFGAKYGADAQLAANEQIQSAMAKAAKEFGIEPGQYNAIHGGLDVMLDRNPNNFLFRMGADGTPEMKWIDPFAVKPIDSAMIETSAAVQATKTAGATAAEAAGSSAQSLDSLLGEVWSKREAGQSVSSNDIYRMYNAATETNQLSRTAGSYLEDISDIAASRPAGARSSLQNYPVDVAQAAKAYAEVPGAAGRISKDFFRFESSSFDSMLNNNLITNRVYVNAAADTAPDLMKFVVQDLIDSGQYPGVAMAKVSGPGAVGARSENIVIYANAQDAQRVADALAQQQALHPEWFMNETPLMTQRLAPGIAAGEEPLNVGGAASFGSIRSDAIANAARRATTEQEFRDLVANAFRRVGVDPLNPHLNLRPGVEP